MAKVSHLTGERHPTLANLGRSAPRRLPLVVQQTGGDLRCADVCWDQRPTLLRQAVERQAQLLLEHLVEGKAKQRGQCDLERAPQRITAQGALLIAGVLKLIREESSGPPEEVN